MLLEAPEFSDNRGRFPESIRAHVPRGTNAALKWIADSAGVKPAEFVRTAVLDRLEAALAEKAADQATRKKP